MPSSKYNYQPKAKTIIFLKINVHCIFGAHMQEQIENRSEGMTQKDAAKVKGDILHRIHSIMDRAFQINENILESMLKQRKTDEFYETTANYRRSFH